MTPKVSIIMTTYNVEATIKISIDSVFQQTLKEIELICVDGGSSDKTREILNDYSVADGRIKLYDQIRPGLGAAKNQGIESATGEYITFLDADDYYVDPSALEKMYDVCKRKKIKICAALRSTVFADGTVIDEKLHRSDCKDNPDGKLIRYIDKQYDYHFHSYLYDRKMIIDSEARFAEVKAYDDTHFFVRAMLKAEYFYVIPVELYRYRCGPAYDWGKEKADDAIKTLTDQLILSAENKLALLHWLTVQRINYEYGRIFENNIRSGDESLLKDLIIANKSIDEKLIEQVLKDPPSEQDYLEPMIHRKYEDMPLRKIENCYGGEYLLEPLWRILSDRQENNSELIARTNKLTEELTLIKESRAYRLACVFAKMHKKIKGIISKLRDIFRTVR